MPADLPNDEIRRQLRASQREHDAVLPAWRRALSRVFDPASGASTDDQAQLLGLPARRTFLAGGATLAAGAVLAACGSDSTDQIPVTGAGPTVPESTTTTAPGSPAENIVLLKTGQSIELLAVDAYQAALDSDLVTSSAIAATARLFQGQHREHGEALGETLRNLGATEVSGPNQFLLENVVQPGLEAAADETMVVQLAVSLESLAAATYVKAAGVLTTPELRQTIMSIGGVEARHLSVLYGVLGTSQVPTPFLRTGAAAPELAYVD
ncbi:ferritin-like domain-containing protein [Rhabdothermincola salaria]|uniref:ferritin-like domain-containing protein n=1 Tax=Rhabdothermincola salaria TaxID=2903142 RepID=UPI001E429E9F|nr:ferritin-like domain-containing protein [Rhabdothermincola salaria]MCD9622417.1 ferritin-like domain-containing protein [Rhabdothermincola salaria]